MSEQSPGYQAPRSTVIITPLTDPHQTGVTHLLTVYDADGATVQYALTAIEDNDGYSAWTIR